MYAMLGTCLDISFAAGVLGRCAAKPKLCPWEAAKHTLCYLSTTACMSLCYHGRDVNQGMDFHRYTDSDWSGEPDISRSTSGYSTCSKCKAGQLDGLASGKHLLRSRQQRQNISVCPLQANIWHGFAHSLRTLGICNNAQHCSMATTKLQLS